MLAFAAFAVAHVVGPGRSLARSTVVQRRGMRRTAPVRMPEGPECLVHAQTLEHNLRGRQLRRALVLSGRYAGDGTAGRGGPPEHWDVLQRSLPLTVERVRCHGKFIHWSLVPQAVNTESREAEESAASPPVSANAVSDAAVAAPLSFWSTLGMTGAWAVERTVHSRVAFEFAPANDASASASDALTLYFNDQRGFGSLTVCLEADQLARKLGALGPSWLADGGLPLDDFMEVVDAQCSTKRRAQVAVAKFLMDQSKLAGIGNYLLSETLHRASVHPFAKCADLSGADWAQVHAAASNVTAASYAAQVNLATARARGSLSLTHGTLGAMAQSGVFSLRVYRQTVDPVRGLPVRKETGPHGRSIFWVPEMQTRGAPPTDDV